MKIHKISGKVFTVFIVILLMAVNCTACSSDTAEEEMEADAVHEEEIRETENEEETVKADITETETIEEDTNQYGNTVGNLYNQGFYVEYEDGAYLVRNREGQVFMINNSEEAGVYLAGADIYKMNYYDGKLYGILDTENEQLQDANGLVAVIEIGEENEHITINVLEDIRPEYMYVVNGKIYYSDNERRGLISYDPVTEEEEVLLEGEIYFPSIYKDRVIFQNYSDGESLYSVSLEGGEAAKLNDMRSFWPIVYKDKIYYQGVKDAAYTLRCMKLDGSEDVELASVEFEAPVICGDKVCFVDISDSSTVSYLDLRNTDAGVQKLDIGDKLIEQLMSDEEVISSGVDMYSYRLCNVSNLSYINGCLMFWTLYGDENDNYVGDNAMYDFDKGEVSPLPWYYSE